MYTIVPGLLRSSVFSLILDSSVGLSAGIQSAGDSVPETLLRILHSEEEDNLSPFDSKIACLCQNIEINNNKYVYIHTHTYTYIIETAYETSIAIYRDTSTVSYGEQFDW